jgi:hypothetical protein
MRFTPRTRRLLLAGVATACVATAGFGAVAANAAEERPAPFAAASAAPGPARPEGSAPPARPEGSAPPARPEGSAPPARPNPTPEQPAPAPLGDVIPAGFGDWVFYAEAIDSPAVKFGIMAGRRTAAGLQPEVMANEPTEGGTSATAPGFHAVSAGMTVGEDDHRTPAFGYYAGPAKKITAKHDGRTVTARQATWSEDRSIVVFWFDPAKVGDGFSPTGLAAFDADGKKLPTGNAEPGVG